MKNLRRLLFFTCLFTTVNAWCQADSTKSFSLLFEEDFFWEFIKPAKNLDKDYTGGGILSFKCPFVQKAGLTFVNRNIDRLFHLNKIEQRLNNNYNETFRVGLTTFTPEGKYLNIKTPLQGQRPYASFIFAGTTRNFLNAEKATALTTQLDIGMLGTYAGREAQAFIHRMYKKANDIPDTARPYDPAGWENQISNGGELSLLYNVTYKKLLSKNDHNLHSTKPHLFDAFITGGLNLGLYNSVTGSMTVRAGVIRMPWHQFNSFPVNEAQLDSLMPAKKGFWRNTELFTFLTVRPTVMAYSVPLQGQFRRSDVVFNSAEVEHLIGQVETGFVLSFWRVMTINATYIYRTRAYKTLYGKEHSYFSVGISFRSPYNS
jgi:hypothetical protein